MESEIKLLARNEDVDALLHSAVLQKYAVTPPVEHWQVDTYFDTPEHAFKASHASLRLRKTASDTVQTLKAGNGSTGGLHRRAEYQSPVAADRPALPPLRKMVGRKNGLGSLLHSRKLKERLMPVFSTQVKRTVIPLKLDDGDLVECVIDVGEIICNGAKLAICELELELKAGDAAHLYQLALELSDTVPLTLDSLSKAERGYALLAPTEVAAHRAAPVALNKQMSVEQAFVEIAGNCIAQIEANAAGVVRRDSEALHQMRVGMRRLRSAFGLTQGLIDLPAALGTEVEWLASELGAARDWDVLAHGTLDELGQACPAEPHIAQVSQAALDESEQARRLAAEAIGAPRYARLMLSLAQWRSDAGWRTDADGQALARLDARITGFARKALASSHKRLVKRGGQLDGASAEASHRVRIAAKRARYISEFFQSLFDAGAVRSYVRRLSGLQDEFGRLNDMAVADRLLSALQEKQPALGRDADFVRGFLAASAQQGRRDARKSWRKFTPAQVPH